MRKIENERQKDRETDHLGNKKGQMYKIKREREEGISLIFIQEATYVDRKKLIMPICSDLIFLCHFAIVRP